MKSKIIFLINLLVFTFIVKTSNADMIIPGANCVLSNESCYNSCVKLHEKSPLNGDLLCSQKCCIKTQSDMARETNLLILISFTTLIGLIIFFIRTRIKSKNNSH